MFLQGVISVMPLILLILFGFACAKSPWFGKPGMHFLSKFCIDIAVPPYLFYSMLKTYSSPAELMELFRNLQYPFMLILCNLAIGLCMARLLKVRPPRRGVFINAVTMSNTIVMGLPVAASLFGDQVIPIAMIYYAANTILFWTVGVWLVKRDVGEDDRPDLVRMLKAVFTTKPMLGFLLGIVWILLDVRMPDFAMRTLGMIGNTTTPLAMMFIGSVIRFAEFHRIEKLRELYIVVAYRALAVPVTSGIILSLLPIPVLMKKTFYIMTNMPAMAQLPIMAKEAGSDYEFASITTAATTALSMAMVPIYVSVMTATGFLG